ncbi:hypothetical protein ACFV7R_24060 [Streptomyces sp. NPDC059866]|uniref:hypothetical protein n=1 Tax=Streptomyces sp. NPDC059866 TaxID=3346978 RepID=UPI0036665164
MLERTESRVARRAIAEGDAERPLLGPWKHDTDKEAGGPDGNPAIRQQLLEMPAPVVADALGYHDKTTTRLRTEAGGTWSRYAPRDHTRSPAGWTPPRNS